MSGGKCILSIYWDEYENVLLNDDGEIIYNVFDIITPNQLFLLKEKRDTIYVPSRILPNVVYEFVFRKEDDDDGYYYTDKDF